MIQSANLSVDALGSHPILAIQPDSTKACTSGLGAVSFPIANTESKISDRPRRASATVVEEGSVQIEAHGANRRGSLGFLQEFNAKTFDRSHNGCRPALGLVQQEC